MDITLYDNILFYRLRVNTMLYYWYSAYWSCSSLHSTKSVKLY